MKWMVGMMIVGWVQQIYFAIDVESNHSDMNLKRLREIIINVDKIPLRKNNFLINNKKVPTYVGTFLFVLYYSCIISLMLFLFLEQNQFQFDFSKYPQSFPFHELNGLCCCAIKPRQDENANCNC